MPQLFRFLDPKTSQVEFETKDRDEATDYINDPFIQEPLVIEIYEAGKLTETQLLHCPEPAQVLN